MLEWSPIELTPDERALYETIVWEEDVLRQWDQPKLTAMLNCAGMLTESLLQRGAVPAIRLEWFTSPQWNIERRWRSRREAFESAGIAASDIYRHRQFLSSLWYFIHGPKLPEPTIKGFQRVLEEHRDSGAGRLGEVCAFVRREVQRRRLQNSGDEFLKLALECGQADMALAVRSNAMAQENRPRQR